MDTKQIFLDVREACKQANSAKNNEIFDIAKGDKELAADFIAYCMNVPEGEEVPQRVADVWESIPQEWIDDTNNIPAPKKEKKEKKGTENKARRAAKKSVPPVKDENGNCRKFGHPKDSLSCCKKCAAEQPDEFLRCKDEAIAIKERKAAERAAAREAKKAEREAARTKMTDEERAEARKKYRLEMYKSGNLSRYGHRPNSISALIDDAIYKGINHEDLVKTILMNNPDTTEDKARIKIRDHIAYLPKKRGVIVTIIKEDNAPVFYKTTMKEWCKDPEGFLPTENVIDDRRTQRPVTGNSEAEPKKKRTSKKAKKQQEQANTEPAVDEVKAEAAE